MKKTVLALGTVVAIGAAVTFLPAIIYSEQQTVSTPEYAKWGKLALEHTKSKYPNASIIDYLHIGRETNSKTTTESFKFWLKEGDHEFGLYLHITFSTKTEEIIEVKEQETNK